MWPQDTPKRYASDAKALAHPHRRALILSVGWGLLMWLTALRFDTRPGTILLVVLAALSFGYSMIHLIRRRHRRSLYWADPRSHAS